MFSCSRLLIHASSSCLQLDDLKISKEAQENYLHIFLGQISPGFTHLVGGVCGGGGVEAVSNPIFTDTRVRG